MNSTLTPSALNAQVKTSASGKKKILVVDDDAALRQVLIHLLTEEGFSVLPAANGIEAVEFAELVRFDLVLMELNLPIKDGWETFEELTAENPLLPIVVITSRPNQLFPAIASGVSALLEKPLNFHRLFQMIRSLLQEPTEVRLARLSGQSTNFSYAPAGAEKDEKILAHA